MTMIILDRLDRKERQSILIHPAEGLDPVMTVAELFASGPIKVVITKAREGDVGIGIDVPGSLCVIQPELFSAGICSG